MIGIGWSSFDYDNELLYNQHIALMRQRYEHQCAEDETVPTETGFAMWLRQQSMDNHEEPDR